MKDHHKNIWIVWYRQKDKDIGKTGITDILRIKRKNEKLDYLFKNS